METVQEKVIHLIQKIGVEEEVKPEASLMDDLGLESLQIYTMLSDLEILFSIPRLRQRNRRATPTARSSPRWGTPC